MGARSARSTNRAIANVRAPTHARFRRQRVGADGKTDPCGRPRRRETENRRRAAGTPSFSPSFEFSTRTNPVAAPAGCEDDLVPAVVVEVAGRDSKSGRHARGRVEGPVGAGDQRLDQREQRMGPSRLRGEDDAASVSPEVGDRDIEAAFDARNGKTTAP
jgi:hypothetical protein